MRQDPATTAQSTGTGSDLLSPRVLGNGHQVTTQMLGCGCPKPSWPVCVTRALNREPGDLQQVSMRGKHRSWGTEPAPKGPQETMGSRSGATLHPTPRGPKTPGLRRAKVRSGMRNPDIQVMSAIRMMDMMTLKPRSFLPGPAGGKSPGHAPRRSREWPQMRHLLSRLARVEKDVDLESVQPGPGHELKATDTLPSREPPDELLSPRTVLMAPAGTTDVGLSAPQRSRRKGALLEVPTSRGRQITRAKAPRTQQIVTLTGPRARQARHGVPPAHEAGRSDGKEGLKVTAHPGFASHPAEPPHLCGLRSHLATDPRGFVS